MVLLLGSRGTCAPAAGTPHRLLRLMIGGCCLDNRISPIPDKVLSSRWGRRSGGGEPEGEAPWSVRLSSTLITNHTPLSVLRLIPLLSSWGTTAPAAGIPRRVLKLVKEGSRKLGSASLLTGPILTGGRLSGGGERKRSPQERPRMINLPRESKMENRITIHLCIGLLGDFRPRRGHLPSCFGISGLGGVWHYMYRAGRQKKAHFTTPNL